MKLQAIILIGLALALTSCASPLVIPKPPSLQAKVTHSADWSALAGRSVTHLVDGLSTPPSAVYVAPGPSDMPFAIAFRSLLEAKLLARGVRVQETATGAVVLRFEVQSFWYKDERQKLPVEYASFWTTAAVLGAQARNISSIDTALGVAGAAGPVMDILKAMFDTTNAEVALTLTVFDGTHLSYRDSETFYIRPTELPFYWSQVPDFVPQSNPPTPQEIALPVRAGRL
jgi:hypothetical protein